MAPVFFVLSLAAWLVVLFALLVCFRSVSQTTHKWLWAAVIVLWMVQVTLRTTDGGALAINSVVIAFPGADYMSIEYQHRLFIPVGALVFLAWRRLRRR